MIKQNIRLKITIKIEVIKPNFNKKKIHQGINNPIDNKYNINKLALVNRIKYNKIIYKKKIMNNLKN